MSKSLKRQVSDQVCNQISDVSDLYPLSFLRFIFGAVAVYYKNPLRKKIGSIVSNVLHSKSTFEKIKVSRETLQRIRLKVSDEVFEVSDKVLNQVKFHLGSKGQ